MYNISYEMKQLLNNNKDLINENSKESWEKFYNNARNSINGHFTSTDLSTINQMLLNAGINPLAVLDKIPDGFFFRQDIERFIIPNNIKAIGGSAFQWCPKLKYVYIPKSINIIGEYAFKDCNLNKMVLEYEGTEEEFDEIIFFHDSHVNEIKNKIFKGN